MPHYFLVIIGIAFLWYALIPIIGVFIVRRKWRKFRGRFDDLRSCPMLDYALSCGLNTGLAEFRFTGNFESVTEDKVLWIRSGKLTIPVDLARARTFVLPHPSEEGIPAAFDPGEEALERIGWDRIAALTGEAKVFVGGVLTVKDKRRIFVSTPEKFLLVIFYEGEDRFLTIRAIRAGRAKNEYFNFLTPYSLILGAFSQALIVLAFFSRPAFRELAISAFTALFLPLLPWVPPGILFTIACRRLWWQVYILRAYRDLAGLLLHYASPGGEPYIVREYPALSGDPSVLIKRYNKKALLFELLAVMLLLAGVGVNLVFIRIIRSFLGI
jgi:hypothetical protein